MAMQCDRGARVTLEQELAAVLRDLAVVHHHPQLAGVRLSTESGEDERQVEITDPDLDGAAKRPAREKRVAPDAVCWQLVPASGDEHSSGRRAEVAADVPPHGKPLARLGLLAGATPY